VQSRHVSSRMPDVPNYRIEKHSGRLENVEEPLGVKHGNQLSQRLDVADV
jgi:hypothetical protein